MRGLKRKPEEYRKGLLPCQPALWLVLGLASLVQAAGARVMPPLDTLEVASCSLLKAEAAPISGTGKNSFLLNPKKVPKSVKPFLKVSGLVDFRQANIQKAARKILKSARGLEGGEKNPASILKAAEAWAGGNLSDVPTDSVTASSGDDWRKCWPKASGILKSGRADALGKARVMVALLRALGVPARSCRVSGQPRAQAWMQYRKAPVLPKSAKKAKGFRAPLGRWVVSGGTGGEAAVDAYSFEAGELASLRWSPDQELAARDLGQARAYYSLSESVQAQADYASLTSTGALPDSCLSRATPPAADQAAEYLILDTHRFSLTAEGPMDPLNELEVLVPYVPHLKSWGAEEPPVVRRLEAWQGLQTLWTNRPGRLRNGKEGVHDEWKSPPPALGTQHYLSAYFRRPMDILEGGLQGLTLTGQVVRSDSLQKREGIKVLAEFLGNSPPAEMALELDGQGRFTARLTFSPTGRACLRLKAVQSRDDEVLVKDSLILDAKEP